MEFGSIVFIHLLVFGGFLGIKGGLVGFPVFKEEISVRASIARNMNVCETVKWLKVT